MAQKQNFALVFGMKNSLAWGGADRPN